MPGTPASQAPASGMTGDRLPPDRVLREAVPAGGPKRGAALSLVKRGTDARGLRSPGVGVGDGTGARPPGFQAPLYPCWL